MKRTVAALLAVMIALFDVPIPAAAAPPPAAEPFPVVPLPAPAHRSHAAAWLAIGSGAALLGTSFLVHHRANQTYDVYLASTNPDEIGRLYDRTANLDRLSSGTLIAGEVLFATGVYLRFLRQPRGSGLSFELSPDRCAALWRF